MEPGEQKRRALALVMAPGYADRHPEEMEHIAEIGRCERVTKEAFYRQVRAWESSSED